MIVCAECGVGKGDDQFQCSGPKRHKIKRLATRCLSCRGASSYNRAANRARSAAYYRENRAAALAYCREQRESDVAGTLVKQARARARKLGLPFDLEPSALLVPEVCPALGIPLRVNKRGCGPDSPSLDRIVPARGYVHGNVVVVSHRANTIKSDATIEEIRAVVDYYSALGLAVTAMETKP